MIDLNRPTGAYGQIPGPCDELKKHGTKLQSIKGLRKQLQYYNENICSLAFYNYGSQLHIHGKKDSMGGDGRVFFEYQPGTKEFAIYLDERQKELNRITKILNSKTTYTEKLRAFFEHIKGEIRFDELYLDSTAWTEFIASGDSAIPLHLSGKKVEINLQPSNPEQREAFNLYLLDFVQGLPNRKHWLIDYSYKPFNSAEALNQFREQANRAMNKHNAVKQELDRVKDKFRINRLSDYTEYLYPYDVQDYDLWINALVNAFLNGVDYDFSKQQLNIYLIKCYLHAKEIENYYRALNDNPLKAQKAVQAETETELSERYLIPMDGTYSSAEKAFAHYFAHGKVTETNKAQIIKINGYTNKKTGKLLTPGGFYSEYSQTKKSLENYLTSPFIDTRETKYQNLINRLYKVESFFTSIGQPTIAAKIKTTLQGLTDRNKKVVK